MQAGQLRHRVTIQDRAATRDAYGQPVPGWADVATVWADIRFLKGIEVARSAAPVSVATCSIRIRFRAGMTAGMRIVEGATHYNIKAILPDATGARYLDCVCETGANDG